MYISVFYEFKNKELLFQLVELFPYLKLDISSKPTTPMNSKIKNIVETNAKLFYDEGENIEEILNYLPKVGVSIEFKNIPYVTITTIKKTILDRIEIHKCPCGNSYEKKIYKEITENVKVTKNTSDRVILRIL